MRTLTDGYQIQEKPTFATENGMIEIPFVRIESVNQPDQFYSVRLQKMDEKNYELKQLDENSITDFSQVEPMPFYSTETGVLELPNLSGIDDKNHMASYISQLKYVSTNRDKVIFELLYVKKLQ
jgi:hypothetical protein